MPLAATSCHAVKNTITDSRGSAARVNRPRHLPTAAAAAGASTCDSSGAKSRNTDTVGDFLLLRRSGNRFSDSRSRQAARCSLRYLYRLANAWWISRLSENLLPLASAAAADTPSVTRRDLLACSSHGMHAGRIRWLRPRRERRVPDRSDPAPSRRLRDARLAVLTLESVVCERIPRRDR